jgi:TolB-like protein
VAFSNNNNNKGFLHELIRRNVIRVAVAYTAVAWALIQVADIVLENIGAPAYFMQAFMLFTILGVPIVLILAWVVEITPDGVRLASNIQGSSIQANLREAIAVLPFTNMSSDSEIEHLADGLSDNIITACQHHLTIPVTSRNSTFVYKNQPITIRNVAAELDVAFVLEGSIQKQSDSIRVTAQLIQAADDSHRWADHFDKKLDDTFAVQDELTESIVAAIRSALAKSVVSETATSDGILAKLLKVPNLFTVSLVAGGLITALFALLLFLPDSGTTNSDLAAVSFGWLTGLILAGSVVGLLGAFYLHKRKQKSHALEEIMPKIQQLVDQDHYTEAFDLAQSIDNLLTSEQKSDQWLDTFSTQCSISCEPAQAMVYYRPYNGRNIDWRYLGVGPQTDIRLPTGNLQLRFECDGYESQEFALSNPGVLLQNFELPALDEASQAQIQLFKLERESDAKPGMVYVAERDLFLSLTGLPISEPIPIHSFHIDKFPVTNAEFQSFVASGGYTSDDNWSDLPWPDGQDWRDLVAGFTDATGEAGPAGWELGTPPTGEEDLPVTGVSWFEAAAYARFAGKRLPNVYEWARAAVPYDAAVTTIPVAMMKFSNFLSNGKSASGEFQSLNGCGAFDMFGNVREWAWNEVGQGRGNLGGCHSDLDYFAVWVNSDPAMDRTENHGFRCVTSDEPQAELQQEIVRIYRDYKDEQPVSDEAYLALIQPLFATPAPTNPTFLTTSDADGIKQERFEIDTGYGVRMPLVVLSPHASSNAIPSIVCFPGMGSFMGSTIDDDIGMMSESMEFIIRQLGCSLVYPCFRGAYERFDHGPIPAQDVARKVWLERTESWCQELSQTIDFIEQSDHLDGDRVGFMGLSYGAIFPTAILALEKRLKTTILISGNLQAGRNYPIADSINYYPRILHPVLMMNGRFDTIVSSNETLLQKRMDWLGTPDEDKQQILYGAGHWPFPQNLFKRDMSRWLQKYLI